MKLNLGSGRTVTVGIEISAILNGTKRKIAEREIPVKRAALFSALVTNESNGELRARQAVADAGLAANRRLGYGVTPIFSPTKEQINEQLARHSVWVHSGHGSHTDGIMILKKREGRYFPESLKASDIPSTDLSYDFVFMNTCESTDRKYVPSYKILHPQIPCTWYGPFLYTNETAVLDIGRKLNAVNYVGWDCEVVRQFSTQVPSMLVAELDSPGIGQTRTVSQAVDALWLKLQRPGPKPSYWYYGVRLRFMGKPSEPSTSTTIDLNEKPY
ncbi:MAG: hypothetical protein J6U40_09970 [Kiritimatiellae bacterium]|nr:hypothetical protein [Kiritimatiellia bacterium]MBP5225884.1 hypothetical protein [Kiritimatiellia bacterium]